MLKLIGLFISFVLFDRANCYAEDRADEVFRFNRCYAQFTRTKVKSDQDLLLKVKSGETTGAAACRWLLERTGLSDSGGVKNKDEESLAVFRTFQAFHRNFFKFYDLRMYDSDGAMSDFYDINEMAYHYTYALFKKNYAVSNVITAPGSFESIRMYGERPKFFLDEKFGVPEPYDTPWNLGKDTKDWKVRTRSFGELVGIKSKDVGHTFVNFKSKNGEDSFKYDPSLDLGAGVIGTSTYLLLNGGQVMQPPDGGIRVHRRWSKSVLSDILCRDLPLLETADVKELVEPKSDIAFRRSEQCMTCHGTIDPMAGVIRNIELFRAGGATMDVVHLRAAVPLPQVLKKDEYYRKPPEGRLMFRNFENRLVNQKVESLADLGKAISMQDDFYLCTAKRYVNFLTGMDVQISADFKRRADKDAGAVNPENFILIEAMKLKEHQSISQLIENIISSPYYLRRM